MSDPAKTRRHAERVRELVASLVREIKDPRLGMVTVTDARITDVVKWTIFYVEGAEVLEGLSAFGEFWPRDAAPPAITVVRVSEVGPPGALLEIEAVAAVGG